MALLLGNKGEKIVLEALVNKTPGQNLVLRLFTNNKTPAEGDAASDYTEAAGFGYSPITLTGSNWGAASEGDPSSIAHPEQTFAFNGALGNVYGYFLTQVTSGLFVLAELFPGGPINAQANVEIAVTPTITAN